VRIALVENDQRLKQAMNNLERSPRPPPAEEAEAADGDGVRVTEREQSLQIHAHPGWSARAIASARRAVAAAESSSGWRRPNGE
jgi:hypothetical protein